MNTVDDILSWLGTDSQGVPIYLHPLNLVWSPEGDEHDLLNFQHVVMRLQTDRPLWSAAIRASNWRPTLAGCVCLLVAHERGFFRDLRDTFARGTWVLPQVAVTLALLHPRDARTFFEGFLASGDPRFARQLLCAQCVLERLGVPQDPTVSPSGGPGLDADYAAIANDVILKHWSFWSSRQRS
jgi:hypothetical protein